MIIKRLAAPKLKHYKQYRRYVRHSFGCKCAFCTTHEVDLGGPKFFRIDHYIPRSVQHSLTHVYENLLYACDICNHFKGNDWDRNPVSSGRGYLDPCIHDYADHFQENEDGLLMGRTIIAKYMIEHLYLNRSFLQTMRVKRIRDGVAHRMYTTLIAKADEILIDTTEAELRIEIIRALGDIQAGKSQVEKRIKENNTCRSESFWFSREQVRIGGPLGKAIKQIRREASSIS